MRTLVVYRTELTTAPADVRVALVADQVFASSARDVDAVETVLLATCERFEVYASSDSRDVGCMLRAACGSHPVTRSAGVDAVRHLFRVASGLESRIVGEPHVLGQLRSALAQATERGTAGLELRAVFRSAIDCGRRVRERCAFGAAGEGYVARALAMLQSELGPLADRHVVIVGAGALGRELARALRQTGVGRLTIVGRHAPRIQALAGEVSGAWVTLDAFGAGFPCDAIITAVSAAQPVLGATTIGACHPRLVIDLGAAPNVDLDATTLGVRLVGLASLGGPASASVAAAKAALLVEAEVDRFVLRHRRTWPHPARLARLAS